MTMDKNSRPKKSIPTIFPTGFGLRIGNGGIVALDVLDVDYDNQAFVVGSYALNKNLLEVLKTNIDNAIKELEKENKNEKK